LTLGDTHRSTAIVTSEALLE